MDTTLYHSFREAGAPGQPVILALHGTGGDERQFVPLIRQMAPGAGIVAPRGDVSEYGANRFFRRTAEGVYDMQDLALRTGRMARFVETIRTANPGRPLFAFGYSNGANILAALLFREPGLVDRAALLHPLIPWRPEPQGGLDGKPVLVTAGLNDPICPVGQSEALVAWFNAQGAQVERLMEPGGHEIRRTELAALQRFLTAPATQEAVR